MRARLLWSAAPGLFQPKPVKSQQRSQSSATQAEAPQTAKRMLRREVAPGVAAGVGGEATSQAQAAG